MLEPRTDAGWTKRYAAAARFERLGWPTTKLESWHWFSTKALQDFDLTRPPETRNVALPPLPEPRVVFIDGRFAPHLLALGPIADLVEVRALSDYDDDTVARVVGRAEPDFTNGDGGLEAANLAFLTDGLHLHVRPERSVPLLHVVHITTGEGVVHARQVIEVGARASLTVLVHHLGFAEDAPNLTNLVTELHVGASANLSIGKRVEASSRGNHLEACYAVLESDARLSSFSLSLDGERVRTAITARLTGPRAEARVDGLYLGHGASVLDHMSDLRHEAPHTTSAETWAGVLDGQSTGTFQGIVRIARNAAKSRTRQLTRTLLLSEGAQANAKPELHIDCDDIEASHGASVGQLNPLERFYLESRGISPEDARRMLISAFVERVLTLAPGPIAASLRDIVSKRLGVRDEFAGIEDFDVG